MREDRKQVVRQQIVEAATRLLIDEGLSALTIRRVASSVEYSPMALYAYFPGKPQLLQAVAEHLGASLVAWLRERIAGVDEGVVRVRRLLEAYLAFGRERPREYHALFHALEVQTEGARATPGGAVFQLVCESVAPMLPEGQRTPDRIAPLAMLLWAGAHGIASLQLLLPGESAIPAAGGMVSMLVEGAQASLSRDLVGTH